VHVVLDVADDEGLATEIGEDAAEVAVGFFADGGIAEEGSAILGGEDGVHEDSARDWAIAGGGWRGAGIQLFQS
jgi:hypothetical protein